MSGEKLDAVFGRYATIGITSELAVSILLAGGLVMAEAVKSQFAFYGITPDQWAKAHREFIDTGRHKIPHRSLSK